MRRALDQPSRAVRDTVSESPGGALPGGFDRLWLLLPALAAAVMTARTANPLVYLDSTDAMVARWWLLSLSLLLLTVGWQPVVKAVRGVRWSREAWRATLPWIVVIAFAAIPRLVRLDRFPTVLDSDESAFIVRAVAFREGQLPGWFSPGFYGNPNLYPVVHGVITDFTGTGVAGYRTLSALIGAIGVVATWRLARHVVGEPAAMLSAILLAAMPLHLHMSRVALNNIMDATSLALALLFAVRTMTGRQRLDAVACGLALAFGFYGYFGGRAIPVVILALIVVLAVLQRSGIATAVRALAWVAGGFLVGATPLLVAFRRNPAEFGGHMAMVSPLSPGRFRADPIATLQVYLPNLRDAIAYPLAGNNQGYFRHEPPYMGYPIAILLVAGLVSLIVRWLRHRDLSGAATLAVPWMLLTAGIATTIPISGQRYLALTPIMAIVAGSGLLWQANLSARIVRTRSTRWSPAVATVAALAIALGHFTWMASEERQIGTYGDHRTVAAYDLGWRLSGDSDGVVPVVFYAGAPFSWSHGFLNLAFLVEGTPFTDIEQPIAAPGNVPLLAAGSLLVLVPERIAERCAIERAYPLISVSEVRDRTGALLYLAFAYGRLPGWSTATTPAGSTLTTVTTSPCGG